MNAKANSKTREFAIASRIMGEAGKGSFLFVIRLMQMARLLPCPTPMTKLTGETEDT